MRSYLLNYLLAAVMLSMLATENVIASQQGDDDLCRPFIESEIDMSAVQYMLDAAARGDLFRIEPSSTMGFCVESVVGLIEGSFSRFNGGFTLEKDFKRKDGRVMMIIETESLDVPGPLIESLLESEDFFNSDEYPEFVFISTGFFWVNQKEAVLIGELTIRDVTRTVGFHVELIDKLVDAGASGQRVQLKASTRIRRSEFGIINLSPLVSDDVTLCMRVNAVRYTPI